MEQYRYTGAIVNRKPLAAEHDTTAGLESQILVLRSTVELQQRQIRRLEAALQLLESQVNSRLR